jgi:hypothetical protein
MSSDSSPAWESLAMPLEERDFSAYIATGAPTAALRVLDHVQEPPSGSIIPNAC